MKKNLILVILILLISISFLTPVRDYFSTEKITVFHQWIHSLGILAPLIFGLIYALGVVISLPGSILTLTGGFLFGVWWGTFINLISATVGASLAFLLARYLLRPWIEKKLQGRFINLDEKIGENGFVGVLVLRLIPLFPFNILNFSLGLTKIKFSDYVLASFLGMAPGCFIYTSIGSVGRMALMEEKINWQDPKIWGPFILVIFLSLIIYWIKKKIQR